MKDFVLLFRAIESTEKPSPEQIQQSMNSWMEWMGQIVAQGKMSEKGSRLGLADSRVLRQDGYTDGPYTEIKEFLNGFIIVRVADLEEATELAKGCPVLRHGGCVEIRPTVTPDDNN